MHGELDAGGGVTLTEIILEHVHGAPRCRSAWECALELGASPATVSGILARLAKQGRVKRFRRHKLYPERASTTRDAWVY